MQRLLRHTLCFLLSGLAAAWSPCTRAMVEFADRSSGAVCTAYFRTQHMFPPPQSLRVRVAELPATYPRLCTKHRAKKRQRFVKWMRDVQRACQ